MRSKLLIIKSGTKTNRQYIARKSYYLQKILDSAMCVTASNFLIHQDGAVANIAFSSPTAALQTPSYLLPETYHPVTVQSLTPMMTRFRQPYGSISNGIN